MFDTLSRAMLSDTAESVVPAWVAGMLGDLAAGGGSFAGVRHPLGFVCLPLERSGARGVCVHIWSDRLASARSTTSGTHAHSWDLTSFVLYGALRNDLIGVTDAPDRPTHRVFEIRTSVECDEISRTGRLVRRTTRANEFYHRGEVYTLPAGVFHETTPQGEVVTVVTGRGRPGGIDVTLGGIDTESHRVSRQVCNGEETAYAAAVAIELLTSIPEPRHREDRCEHRTP
jgi:hypothetical protein